MPFDPEHLRLTDFLDLSTLQEIQDNFAAVANVKAIARLCYQEFQLRQRINELTAVYNVAMMLSEARDLPDVLQRTVRVVAETMGVKAASLRLVDKENDELAISAVYNLSKEYLGK